MFRVWTKNLGRVGKSEAHVYFLALTCSDAEQLGKPFLLKGNFILILLLNVRRVISMDRNTVRASKLIRASV